MKACKIYTYLYFLYTFLNRGGAKKNIISVSLWWNYIRIKSLLRKICISDESHNLAMLVFLYALYASRFYASETMRTYVKGAEREQCVWGQSSHTCGFHIVRKASKRTASLFTVLCIGSIGSTQGCIEQEVMRR